jgi:UTP-glucose-1-phosphate uridylyltransferase
VNYHSTGARSTNTTIYGFTGSNIESKQTTSPSMKIHATSDGKERIAITQLAKRYCVYQLPTVIFIHQQRINGFGYAVRCATRTIAS